MRKDPILACMLNLILVGIGHIYIGQTGKGLLILALGVLLTMTVPIGWIPLVIWAMYDVNSAAKKMNRSNRKVSIGQVE